MDGTSFAASLTDGGAAKPDIAVLRDVRQPGDLRRRWWACTRLDKAPWDFSPETISRFGPDGDYDPTTPNGAVRARRRLLPGSRSGGRAPEAGELRAVVARGRAQPGVAAAGRPVGAPGDLPPLPTATRFSFEAGCRTSNGDGPACHGTVLLDHRGGQRRPTAPRASWSPMRTSSAATRCGSTGGLPCTHLFDARGGDLPAGVDHADPDRGCVAHDVVRDLPRRRPARVGTITLLPTAGHRARATCPRRCQLRSRPYAGMDIGRDNGLVVDRAYEDKAPFAFTGTVKRVVFDLQTGAP